MKTWEEVWLTFAAASLVGRWACPDNALVDAKTIAKDADSFIEEWRKRFGKVNQGESP